MVSVAEGMASLGRGYPGPTATMGSTPFLRILSHSPLSHWLQGLELSRSHNSSRSPIPCVLQNNDIMGSETFLHKLIRS